MDRSREAPMDFAYEKQLQLPSSSPFHYRSEPEKSVSKPATSLSPTKVVQPPVSTASPEPQEDQLVPRKRLHTGGTREETIALGTDFSIRPPSNKPFYFTGSHGGTVLPSRTTAAQRRRRLVEKGSSTPGCDRTIEIIREIPAIASEYLYLGFNVFLVSVLLYMIYAFVHTVRRDIDMKAEEYSADILVDIHECTKQYLENRCHPDHRVPAMNGPCLAWERCMNRDPILVGRAKVGAETFALIMNAFIEPISLKTMFVFLTVVFGSLMISHLAFAGRTRRQFHSLRQRQQSLKPSWSSSVVG